VWVVAVATPLRASRIELRSIGSCSGDFVVRRVDRICAKVIDTPADGLLFVDGVRERYAADEVVLVAARVGGAVLVD
jgi:hypothetical protein